MACETIIDESKRYFVFACNTTDRAFGPLMWVPDRAGDIEEVSENFKDFLGDDPRRFEHDEISIMWLQFCNNELSEN